MAKEYVINKWSAELLLPAEKNVVSYPISNRTKGAIILTNLRVVFQTKKSKMGIPLKLITYIGKEISKWSKGEEDRTISLECMLKSDRYKIIIYTSEEKITDLIYYIRRQIIGKTTIYFKSPASKGGVVDTEQPWVKGTIKIDENFAKLNSPKKQVAIRVNSIVDHGRNIHAVDTKGKPSITIIHVDEKADEEVSTVIIGNDQRLSMIEDHLKDLTESLNADLDLDDNINQLLMALYTGDIDEENLSEMLDISEGEIDGLYDRVIDLNLAKVVKVKRVVSLTNRGIRYIDIMMKKGLG